MRVWIHEDTDISNLETTVNDCLEAMKEGDESIVDVRIAVSESRTVVMILSNPRQPRGLVE